MTTLYTYKRISSTKQLQGDGLEYQVTEDTINRIKAEYGVTEVIELESAIGLSGFHGDHLKEGEALYKFIEACKAGEVEKGSILAVYSLDRLGRMTGLESMSDVYAPIVLNGVRLYTHTEQQLFDGSDMSQLMATLLFQRAHNESKTKSQRVLGSVAYKVQEYLTKGIRSPRLTKAPFWVDNNTCQLNQWADVVKQIVDRRCNGAGINDLAEWCREKYPKFTQRKDSKTQSYWNNNIIQTLLADVDMLQGHKTVTVAKGNELYQGTWKLENYYPSVITQEQVTILTNLKGKKVHKPKQRKLISNVYCGCCGYSLSVIERPKHTAYFCTGSLKGKSECKRNYVNVDFVDRVVLLLLASEIYRLNTQENDNEELLRLHNDKTSLETSLDNLVSEYNKTNSVTLLRMITSTETALQEVSEVITKLETPKLDIGEWDKVITLYNNWNDTEIKRLFNTLVKRVECLRVDEHWKVTVTSLHNTISIEIPKPTDNRGVVPNFEGVENTFLPFTMLIPNQLVKDGYFTDMWYRVRGKKWEDMEREMMHSINNSGGYCTNKKVLERIKESTKARFPQ